MKKITSFVKTLVLGCVLAVGVSAGSQGQAVVQYQSQNLIATNLWIFGGTAASTSFSTNLLAQNYFTSPDPNYVAYPNGVFPVPPIAGAAPALPAIGSDAGVCFQLTYEQQANNGSFFPTNATPTLGIPTNGEACTLELLIQPILDDASLQNLGNLYSPTNPAMFSVAIGPTAVVISTNGLCTATGWTSATNFLGCKYGKLVGLYSAAFTNAFWLQSLREGSWAATIPK
jgi:hypothetical protein